MSNKSKIEFMDAQPFIYQAAKPQPTGARDRLDSAIKQLATSRKVTYIQAFTVLLTEQPALFETYQTINRSK